MSYYKTYWRQFCLVILCLAGISQFGCAQTKSPFIWGAAFQQGSIIMHTPKIRHFSGTSPNGLELNVQYQTTGKQAWQQLYRYPRIGAALTYFNYHNPVIGQSVGVSTYLNLPVRSGAKGQLHFRFGTGLAYFSQKFQQPENPTNNIISSNYNAIIQTRLEYDRFLSDKLSVLASLGLNHYSNGGWAKPNLGVNIATATVGLNYFASRNLPQQASSLPEITRKNYVSISSSIGLKQRDNFDTVKYVVNSLAFNVYRIVNHKSTLLAGLEGFFDPSLYPRRLFDPRVKPGTKPDIRRVGLNLGHELGFGKVSFGTQVGYYVYRPYKSDAALYQRLETKVNLHKHVFIAAGLKLHDVIKADIIEYRLGLRI